MSEPVSSALSNLSVRLLAVHHSLESARLSHAFGGAIAYAYCSAEPRGTRDIDVNVFAPPARARAVLRALPDEIAIEPDAVARLERDGQVRVDWAGTPIDLFLAVHEFHREVAGDIRWVPFAGETIPVLGCDALAVFKAMFNRTKDWADIEEMAAAGSLDQVRVRATLETLLGSDDDAVGRMAAAFDRPAP
jgi:hypothetical protein